MFSSYHLAEFLRRAQGGRGGAAIFRASNLMLATERAATREQERFNAAIKSGEVVTEITEEQQTASGAATSSDAGVPYWLQADPSLNSGPMLRRRFSLRHHSLVLRALWGWWEAALHTLLEDQMPRLPPSMDHGLGREGYDYILRRVFRCMLPTFEEDAIKQSLDEDWDHDSQGLEALTREQFQDAIFQLADVWTEGVTPEEYADFLWTLLERISAKQACGCPGVCPRRLGGSSARARSGDASGGEVRAMVDASGDIPPSFIQVASPTAGFLDEEAVTFHLDYAAAEEEGEEGEEEAAGGGGRPPVVTPRRTPMHAARKERAFSAMEIQKSVRRRAAKRRAGERRDAAIVVQKESRKHRAKRQAGARRQAATIIGSDARGKIARDRVRTHKDAIVHIQKDWRMLKERKKYWRVLAMGARVRADQERHSVSRGATMDLLRASSALTEDDMRTLAVLRSPVAGGVGFLDPCGPQQRREPTIVSIPPAGPPRWSSAAAALLQSRSVLIQNAAAANRTHQAGGARVGGAALWAAALGDGGGPVPEPTPPLEADPRHGLRGVGHAQLSARHLGGELQRNSIRQANDRLDGGVDDSDGGGGAHSCGAAGGGGVGRSRDGASGVAERHSSGGSGGGGGSKGGGSRCGGGGRSESGGSGGVGGGASRAGFKR
jgi:hypothetical protein